MKGKSGYASGGAVKISGNPNVMKAAATKSSGTAGIRKLGTRPSPFSSAKGTSSGRK